MSSNKRYRKEEVQTEDFSLEEKLRSIGSGDLCELVQTLMKEKPENRKLILEWFKAKSKDMKNMITDRERGHLDEELLWEYWENAKSIISQFNEYVVDQKTKKMNAIVILMMLRIWLKKGRYQQRQNLSSWMNFLRSIMLITPDLKIK